MLDRGDTRAGWRSRFLPAAIAATAAPAKSLAASFEPTSAPSFGGGILPPRRQRGRVRIRSDPARVHDPGHSSVRRAPVVTRTPPCPAPPPPLRLCRGAFRDSSVSRLHLGESLLQLCPSRSLLRRELLDVHVASALFTAARTTCSLGLGNNPAMVPPNMNLLSAETAPLIRRFASCSSAISRSCAGSLVHSSASPTARRFFGTQIHAYQRQRQDQRAHAHNQSFPAVVGGPHKVPPTAAMKTTAVMEAMTPRASRRRTHP